MSLIKSFAVLALATGFAVAKPVNVPQGLPVYKRTPQIDAFGRLIGGGNNNNKDVSINDIFGSNSNNNDFNFINGFSNFNNQQQVLQVQQQNLQIISNDNGRQQAVFEQVNQVLVVDNQRNGFNNQMNNLFRQANQRNSNRDVTVVMMVVTQVNVAIDDGRGNQVQQQVFAQSLLVANRGQRQTQSVMIFDSRTLIAADFIGGGGNNGNRNSNGVGANILGVTGGAALPTKTRDVQLLGAKPTWSSVIEDPAQTAGAAWQAEIEDLQKADQDGADNAMNDQLAQQLKDSMQKQGAEADKAAKKAAEEEQKQE